MQGERRVRSQQLGLHAGLLPGRRKLTKQHYSVAGLGIEVDSSLGDGFYFELPESFESFRQPAGESDVRFQITSHDGDGIDAHTQGELVYESGLNWRIRQDPDGWLYESYHPGSGRVVATAKARESFQTYEVVFDETTLRWLWESAASPMPRPLTIGLPYPLEQLLLLPALARADGFMVHACGAVLNGRAFVFAGHSGDGKTSLARLLADEGMELLSDERIAIRKQDGVFVAHGTPWPGEGNVVSNAAYPLGRLFLLRKGETHQLIQQRRSTLAAELLSRSIVPYYFPRETAQILDLHHEIADRVPLHILEFSLSPGLAPVLSRCF